MPKVKDNDPIVSPGLCVRNLHKFNESVLMLVLFCKELPETATMNDRVKELLSQRVDAVNKFYKTDAD